MKKKKKIISQINNANEAEEFLLELLTESELCVLSKRWQILEMLNQGVKQREIVKKLKVSLCNVTRGAKIMKKQNVVAKKYLDKDDK